MCIRDRLWSKGREAFRIFFRQGLERLEVLIIPRLLGVGIVCHRFNVAGGHIIWFVLVNLFIFHHIPSERRASRKITYGAGLFLFSCLHKIAEAKYDLIQNPNFTNGI